MKKRMGISQINGLTKRKKIFGLTVITGLFLICCCTFAFALSGNSNKVAKTSESLPAVNVATSVAPSVTLTSEPTIAAATTAPTPLPAKLNSCLPDGINVEVAQVVKVVDGDTIDVTIDDAPFTVRYIGIDTPETKDPNVPIQFYGPEAADRNTKLVADQQINLVKDVSDMDRYGRLLRYVFVDGLFVNETLVKEGYAKAINYPPDTACQAIFAQAEEAAKAQAIGLWTAPATKAEALPTEIPTEVPTLVPTLPPPASSGCPQGCTAQQPGCDIKGNINSSGEKIYHVPGSSSYTKTKIDPSNGERWFCTVDEAVANGWRAPKN